MKDPTANACSELRTKTFLYSVLQGKCVCACGLGHNLSHACANGNPITVDTEPAEVVGDKASVA